MRFQDFIQSSVPLIEGMMIYDEWRKRDGEYALPFINAVNTNENPIINIRADGEEYAVVINSDTYNKKVAKVLQLIIKAGGDTAQLSKIVFSGVVLDDDDQPTTEKLEVKLQHIIKDDLITGSLRVNLGNIAELVLGCAVTAKYEKLGAEVTADDVISVAIRLAQGAGTVNSSAGKDDISFQASVPSADQKGFYAFVGEDSKGKTPADYGIKPAVINGINKHIASSVKYVNESPRVATAVNKAAKDPGKNVVDVISDGGNSEQQKTTKVDLKITIDGTKLNLLSIKAGDVGQFGQVSGYEFEKINSFFEQSTGFALSLEVQHKFMNLNTALKKSARVADKKSVRAANYSVGFKLAYDEIEKKLNAVAEGSQVDLLERVYSGLLHHATRNEEGVEMVILSPSAKKAFSELTFGPELRMALDDYHLTVKRGTSEKMHAIQIYGVPKTSEVKKAMGTASELLVQYRSYSQDKAVRNIIEMGNLLKDLADWEKIEGRKGIEPGSIPKVSKPIAAPAPAAPAVPTPAVPTPALTGVSKNVTSMDQTGTMQSRKQIVPEPEDVEMESQGSEWHAHGDDHADSLKRMLQLAKYSH